MAGCRARCEKKASKRIAAMQPATIRCVRTCARDPHSRQLCPDITHPSWQIAQTGPRCPSEHSP
eukprot:1426197-Rhodomonas_salina.1